MRRWVIAFALGAALLLPVAGGAGAAEEEGGGGEAASGEASAAGEAASPPAASPRRVPRRPDLAPAREAAARAEAAGGEEAEEEGPGFWSEHFDSMLARILTGANGIATAPADPVMATVEPPKALEKASYGRYPLGFASGTLLMLYRTFLGVIDLGLAPIPAIPVLSPVPRYKLIPGFQHDDE